jgi:hypothetical protein
VVYLLVFVFAPGIGVQYMVWAAPFLVVAWPRWSVATTAGSTVFLAAYYGACSKEPFPWVVVFPKGPEIEQWGPWSNVAWGMFVAALVWVGWKASRAARLPATAR